MLTSKKEHIIVIKLGTSVLTAGGRSLNKAHMLEIVRQCVLAQRAGHKIIIVSSGAIAAGREHLCGMSLEDTMASKQLLAAVGQSQLIRLWEELFSIFSVHVGQMLLTRADLEERERFLNARDTLSALLSKGIIPIINENDAVATSEIKVGDNDNLSALVAILASADKLILLTDQVGLFTADPRFDPDARLIEEVKQINDDIYKLAGGSVSGLGTGGMYTKIQAADVATRSGIDVYIAPGMDLESIGKVARQEAVGTLFLASDSPLESRKRWLFGPPSAGSLCIDAGAKRALLEKGASLLPKGIFAVRGNFSRGELVGIEGPDGQLLGRGVVAYGSEDLQRIAGKHSDAIQSILGYVYTNVAVHRDDLVLNS